MNCAVLTKRLHDLRVDHDLSQTQVAQAIGVSQRTYSYYETGQRNLPPDMIYALAVFYDVSIDYLFGRTEDSGSFSKA